MKYHVNPCHRTGNQGMSGFTGDTPQEKKSFWRGVMMGAVPMFVFAVQQGAFKGLFKG